MKETRRETTILLSLLLIAVFVLGYALTNGGPKTTEASRISVASGYAWSSNIGWISFNCKDITDLCATSNYRVYLDYSAESIAQLRGYAWSSNIGWISFEPNDLAGCPTGPCEARFAGTDFTGWGKVLSTGEFISLNCESASSCSSSYKATLDESVGDTRGWAWGAGVVGWISFNCVNTGSCGPSNYKVVFPPAPVATCQDIDALNFGDPLPCTYPPAGTSTPPTIRGCETNVGGGTTCPKPKL